MSRHDGCYELGASCPHCSEAYVVRATVFRGRVVFVSHEHGKAVVLDRARRRGSPVFREFVAWVNGPSVVPVPAPWRSVVLQ